MQFSRGPTRFFAAPTRLGGGRPKRGGASAWLVSSPSRRERQNPGSAHSRSGRMSFVPIGTWPHSAPRPAMNRGAMLDHPVQDWPAMRDGSDPSVYHPRVALFQARQRRADRENAFISTRGDGGMKKKERRGAAKRQGEEIIGISLGSIRLETILIWNSGNGSQCFSWGPEFQIDFPATTPSRRCWRR